MKKLLILFLCFSIANAMAQKTDYFYEIPQAPDSYSESNILARLIDGLGFRYYWATYGLSEKEMDFKPNEDARTMLQTLQHIDGLTDIARNTFLEKPTNFATRKNLSDFDGIRAKTLAQLEEASRYLRTHDLNPENQKMVFQSNNGTSEYPLWNLINGPISDALWHVGQVVSFRRSAGNPFPKGVNVLQGSKND